MSILKQSRASFSNGKVVGLMESLLRFSRALEQIKNVFELRSAGESKVDIETWLRDIIALILQKDVIERVEDQTRGICVQSDLAKWYCVSHRSDGDRDEKYRKEKQGVGKCPHFLASRMEGVRQRLQPLSD